VRRVVAFAAGGAADTVARTLSVRASEIIGQQLIIENRTGGNALVAANAVLQSPRDGQTFARHRRRRDRFGDHHHLLDPPAAGGRPHPRAGRHQPQGERATGCGGRRAVTDEPADFTAWLEGQRTLLGKLIVDGNIKLG
jgi:hypothetical protein